MHAFRNMRLLHRMCFVYAWANCFCDFVNNNCFEFNSINIATALFLVMFDIWSQWRIPFFRHKTMFEQHLGHRSAWFAQHYAWNEPTKQPQEKWFRAPHVSIAQIVMLTFILSDELQHLTILFPHLSVLLLAWRPLFFAPVSGFWC